MKLPTLTAITLALAVITVVLMPTVTEIGMVCTACS